MRKKNIFIRFLTNNLPNGFEDETVRKAIMINSFTCIGIIVAIIFSIKSIFQEKYVYAVVLDFTAIAWAIFLLYFKKTNNHFFAGTFNIGIFFILLIYLLVTGGDNRTGPLYYFVFPSVALYIFGRKLGFFYCTILLSITIVLLFGHFDFIPEYSKAFRIRLISSFVVVTSLTYIFEYIREQTYISFIEADRTKTFLLAKVTQQNEEIQAQTDQLELTNKELEVLSVVASHTINAISIFDKSGNTQWVNDGFTRLYGYTLEEFKAARGSCLLEMVQDEKIAATILECFTEKKPVHYSLFLESKAGSSFWVQTALSPILDIHGEIDRVVAIDTDITEIKRAEKEIQEQKEELQSKSDQLLLANKNLSRTHELLTKNINYARQIQQALLPPESLINVHFSESFVFYRPRDVVSGDFYWMSVKNNKIFIAVADCTGHGVSGAFMSMIGNTLLNETVNQKGILDPAEILQALNRGVIFALNQKEHGKFSQDDGMEITVCCIDRENDQLVLASANQLTYLFSNGSFIPLRGDIHCIGGRFAILKKATYTNHTFKISDGLTLYMFSDGYRDQFGGENNTKYMTAKFENFIKSIHQQPMSEQYTNVSTMFYDWKGDEKQIDDILVMGFRI